MTLRKLWTLFRALPPESYVKRVLAAEYAQQQTDSKTLSGDDIDATLRMVR